MKTMFLFITTFLFSLYSVAQEHWSVQLNSKTLLTANTEDTVTNVVSVNDLKKGSLIVTYNPGKAENERKRRLAIYGDNDNELYSKEAFTISIPTSTLKKWKHTTSQIKIYTWPALGAEGANVRLRRVHLCTINFK